VVALAGCSSNGSSGGSDGGSSDGGSSDGGSSDGGSSDGGSNDDGGSSGSGGGEDYSLNLRYAHVNAPDSFVGENAARLAEEVENVTDGRVTMDVFPAAELGDSSEIIEGIKTGSVDLAHNTWAGLASVKEDLAVFDHPYIYEDRDHALRVANPQESELLQEFNSDLKQSQNMQVVGSVYYGYRHTTMNSAATSPSDFDGKKIRAIPWDVYMATVRGLGASPEPVAFSELPSALATGLVNGQENPLTTIYTNNFQDHQSHLILSGHILSVMPIFMNNGSFSEMSSEDQQAFMGAIQTVGETTREETVAREEELVDTLASEGGMTVVEESELDIEAFKESCQQQVADQFPNWDSYIETISNT
jgi:tripartite ATP-independent transporter DctP family solute receptor